MARAERTGRKNIFPVETELSEIVLRKTDEALEKIKAEASQGKVPVKTAEGAVGTSEAGQKRRAGYGRKSFRMQAAAAMGVCILAVSGISAAAAFRYYWGRGMSGELQATEEKQKELVAQGVAKVGAAEIPSAVTCDGVTIAPETVIADERFAYLSFRISGFQAEAWEDVLADLSDIYFADDPAGDKSWPNMSGHIYNGIIADENGQLVYEDGTPVESDAEGRTLQRYTDENGDMTFVIQASIGNREGSLPGRTIHVEFQDIYAEEYDAASHKRTIRSSVSGSWAFDITLPDVSVAKHIAVGQPVADTAFTIESIELSPISVYADYAVSGAPEAQQDESGVPKIMGLILRDGTRFPYMARGGSSGYTDSGKTHAYDMSGFDRVIDVDEVAGLIVSVWDGGSEYRRVEVMLP